MKNQRTLLLYMLTLLLSAIAVPADAQQRQDALYIFRNDGQFNAFFYGDIQRICYSNIDTLGVAHDDFVVQEVWALDTVYRIPVSAIDSVSFVTPENKIKADVFCPDKSIADYIIASDSVWWIRLALNTPTQLIPQKGQKLLIEEPSQYIPNGFGGIVAYAERDSEGWLIITEDVELSDIYDRLLLKAAAAEPSDEAGARRNGLIDGTELNIVKNTPIHLTSVEREVSLKGSYPLTSDDKPYSFSFDATGEIKGKLNAHMNSFRAVIFYDALEYGLKADIKSELSFDGKFEASIAGGMTGRVELGQTSSNNVNGVKVDLGYGFYMEGTFTGLKFSYEKDLGSTVNTLLVVDEKDPFTYKLIPSSIPHFSYHIDPGPSGKFGIDIMNQASFGMGLFAKIGIEGAIPLKKGGKITDFVKKYLTKYIVSDTLKPADGDTLKFLSFEFGADIGGKLDVKFPAALAAQLGITKSIDTGTLNPLMVPPLMETQSIYKALDEDTDVKLSGAFKIGGSLKMGKYWSFEWPILKDVDVESSSHGFVPTLSHVVVGPDEDDQPVKLWKYKITAGIRRNLLPPGVNIGFVVTDRDKKNEIVTKRAPLGYISESIFEKGQTHFGNNTYNLTFDDIDPKKGETAHYTAYPLVIWFGSELLGNAQRDFDVAPANFGIENRELQLFEGDDPERELHLEMKPNMKKVEITPKAKWVKGFFFKDWDNDLEIRYEALPDSIEQRKGTILLKGLSSKTGEVLAEDSIVITQVRAIMELSADTMLFDLKGGVSSIQILRTNLKDIEVVVDAGDKWLSGEIHENYIVMTAEESAEEYRAAIVRVRGYTPGGKAIVRAFWVRQYSTEIVPTVDPDLLVFPLEGGEQTAVFNKADYAYSGVYVSEEGKKWARAKLDDNGVVTVTVDPTKDEQGRGCSVVCWADNSPTPSENAVLVPITVKQVKPEIKKIYFKTFNKVHSEIVRYHEDEPDNFWNWLLMDATAESHEMDLMVTKDNFTIKTSIDGNTMHVDCVGSAQKFGTTQKATLSFDVVNYNAAKPDKAMVTNVKMTNDVTMNAGGGSASMNMKVNVDNIPVWNLSPLYIASAGTVANGVKFSNFHDVISVPDGKATGYYEEDNGNNALLRISFEGNDNDDWTDVVDLEDWGDDDDDDDDWGDWSRSTEKQARQKRVHSALERRLLQQLKNINKQ